MSKKLKALLGIIAVVLVWSCLLSITALAANVNTGVAGLTAESSGSGSWSGSGGTITGSVSVKVTSGCTGDSYSAQTATLTFTNSSGSDAILSFDYSISLNGGSLSIADTSITAGGTFTQTVSAGGTIAVALSSASNQADDASISITNIKLTAIQAVTTTFLVPEHGSYTVDGTAISAQTSISKLNTEPYSLSATPASGYKLMGWMRTIGSDIISYFGVGTATLSDQMFAESSTVVPVFCKSSSPVWGVGSMLYTDLNEAISYAQSSGETVIYLAADGTLPAGNYSIPNGKTVLIPFDAANTVYEETAEIVYNSYTKPSKYRLLTMANGAAISIENGGKLSLPSKLSSKGQLAGYNGTPTGPDGRIKMNTGSTITVNSGGKLYCWGYIYGSGAVEALSGSTVYEAFQIKDWRGGSATSNVYSYAFIFNQYYVQNIEVPLKIHAGAKEILRTAVNASSSAYPMNAEFIGNNGLFKVTSGYIVKDYIENDDRLKVEVHGDVSVSPMTLSGLPLIGSITTGSYIMPITNNITIDVQSGTATVNQDLEFLPGVEIKIASEATMNIASDKKVYVYDKDNWGNFTGSAQLYVIGYSVANGTTAKRNAAGLADAKIEVGGTLNVSGNLYTSEGGAAICGTSSGGGKVVLVTAPGNDNSTIYEMADNKTKTAVTFTPARLQNGDSTYTATAGAAADTEYYYCTTCDPNGRWETEHDAQSYTLTYDKNTTDSVTNMPETYEGSGAIKLDTKTPARQNYKFEGWQVDGEGTVYAAGADFELTQNTMLKAKWTELPKVTFDANKPAEASGTVSGMPTTNPVYVNASNKLTIPTSVPTLTTYRFDGWYANAAGTGTKYTPGQQNVTFSADTTLYAKWVKTYTITWKNYDGSVLQTDTVDAGTTPSYSGGTPSRASTEEFTYTFSGWSPAVVAAAADAEYVAQYTEATRTYTITWKNDDGTTIDTTDVAYGTVPTYADPIKTATAEYTYTFAGWNPEPTAVTGAATYTATYTATKRTYTVTWKNADGTVLETDENVEYGTTPTYDGETPAKAEDAKYTYIFAGWSTDGTNVIASLPTVADNTEYIAAFTSTGKTYDITISTETVMNGSPSDGPSETIQFRYGDTTIPEPSMRYYKLTGWTVNGESCTTAELPGKLNTLIASDGFDASELMVKATFTRKTYTMKVYAVEVGTAVSAFKESDLKMTINNCNVGRTRWITASKTNDGLDFQYWKIGLSTDDFNKIDPVTELKTSYFCDDVEGDAIIVYAVAYFGSDDPGDLGFADPQVSIQDYFPEQFGETYRAGMTMQIIGPKDENGKDLPADSFYIEEVGFGYNEQSDGGAVDPTAFSELVYEDWNHKANGTYVMRFTMPNNNSRVYGYGYVIYRSGSTYYKVYVTADGSTAPVSGTLDELKAATATKWDTLDRNGRVQ